MAKSPLTDEHCAVCDRILRQMVDLEEEIQRLKASGRDTEEFEMRRQYLLNRAKAVKRAYFPDRP